MITNKQALVEYRKYEKQLRYHIDADTKCFVNYRYSDMRRIWTTATQKCIPELLLNRISCWSRITRCLVDEMKLFKCYRNSTNSHSLYSKIKPMPSIPLTPCDRFNIETDAELLARGTIKDLLSTEEEAPIETHTDITDIELCGGTLIRITLEVINDYLRSNPRKVVTTSEYLKAIERLAQLLSVVERPSQPILTVSDTDSSLLITPPNDTK